MNNEEKVIRFLKKNNGYITTSDFLSLNITKPTIKTFISKGIIEKICNGIYMDTNKMNDELYVIQKKYPSAIFSYNTALHVLNLTNRVPINIDITLPRGKTMRGKYNVHYISENFYELGIIEVESPNGNPIKIYNAERCLCDMLKSETEFDLELQNRILDYYFKSEVKDIDKLLDYAKILNVYEKVNTIVGVMMKW